MLLTKKESDSNGDITFTQLSIPPEYFAQDPEVYTPDVQMIYDIQDIKLTDKGALVYIGGATYPHKTIPAGQIVGQLNVLKEYTKQSLKSLAFLRGQGYLKDFCVFFEKCFYSYRVNGMYLCPTARGVHYMVYDILRAIGTPHQLALKTSYYMCHVFEFDDAYRYRLQDLMTSLNVNTFRVSPRKELRRVMKLVLSREIAIGTTEKLTWMFRLVSLIMLHPKYSKAISDAILRYHEYLVFDEADAYWAGFKDNYNFQGVTHEEHKKLNAIPDMYIIQ